MARLKKRFKMKGVYLAFFNYLSGTINIDELKNRIADSSNFEYFIVDNRISDGYINIIVSDEMYAKIFNMEDYDISIITNRGSGNYGMYRNYEDDPYTIEQEFNDGNLFWYFNDEDWVSLKEYFTLVDRRAIPIIDNIVNTKNFDQDNKKLADLINKHHKKIKQITIDQYQSYHEDAVNIAGDEALKDEMCSWLSGIPTAEWSEDGCPTSFYMKISEIVKQYNKTFAGKDDEVPILKVLQSFDASGGYDLSSVYFESGIDEDEFSGFHENFQHDIDNLTDEFYIENDYMDSNTIQNMLNELEDSGFELNKTYEVPGGRYHITVLDIIPEDGTYKVQIDDIIKSRSKEGNLTLNRLNTIHKNFNIVGGSKDTEGFDLIDEIKQVFSKIIH